MFNLNLSHALTNLPPLITVVADKSRDRCRRAAELLSPEPGRLATCFWASRANFQTCMPRRQTVRRVAIYTDATTPPPPTQLRRCYMYARHTCETMGGSCRPKSARRASSLPIARLPATSPPATAATVRQARR
jgi:hypothetical protein